ncbi:hypothetical protein [Streptomyces bambusae]|uniref:Uncharacterized protein n=1 Tax=Streptomyces bambusae TaxID=1550616 RepID=A0ABS6Z7V5_9ACTN|nr:hypothetical protein [Streptomyces bambusae]MBW5483822.1 hypothetical protein [Streptomyces bambusae]
MHDTRVRRIAERATRGGGLTAGTRGSGLTVTLTQLWYLCRTGSGVWGPVPARGVPPLVRWLVAVPLAAALSGCVALTEGFLPAAALLVAAATVLITATRMRYSPARPAGSYVTPDQAGFRHVMSGAWTTAYGQLPQGITDDLRESGEDRTGPRVPGPEAVILCTDRAVTVFLVANELPVRLRSWLVEPAYATTGAALDALAGVPAELPVVVLHDASAQGVLLAPLVRAAYPDRVVIDGGLRPGAVMDRRGAVHLRASAPLPDLDAGQLRAVAGLSAAEADWLADGFLSPIAAVPPAVLASAVEQAVRRATRAAPSPRPATRARAQGFLTWPDPDLGPDLDPAQAPASDSATAPARSTKGPRTR